MSNKTKGLGVIQGLKSKLYTWWHGSSKQDQPVKQVNLDIPETKMSFLRKQPGVTRNDQDH